MERDVRGRELKLDGRLRLTRYTKHDFERHPSEITDLLMSTGRRLLLPKAPMNDLLAFISYPLVDVLNPIFHPYASIEFAYDGESSDPLGWIITWKGHEQQRKHLYLPKKIAQDYINTQLHSTSAVSLALAVIMKEDDKTLVREGFTEIELANSHITGYSLRQDKRGQKVVRYHKMLLTNNLFRKARRPKIKIEIPEREQDYSERRIKLPSDVMRKLPAGLGNAVITVRRVTMQDYPIVDAFHKENSDHPTLKPIDIQYPNYLVFADGHAIAMSGSISETGLQINGKGIPMILAGNLVVARDWRNTGLGSSLSYATKAPVFKRNSDSLIFADNVDTTRDIWVRTYNSPVVCTMGWLVLQKN